MNFLPLGSGHLCSLPTNRCFFFGVFQLFLKNFNLLFHPTSVLNPRSLHLFSRRSSASLSLLLHLRHPLLTPLRLRPGDRRPLRLRPGDHLSHLPTSRPSLASSEFRPGDPRPPTISRVSRIASPPPDMATTTEVVKKFFVASVFMWMLPITVLYGFHHNWYPGLKQMSPESQTLLSGFVAVISVNVVIVYYIYMALKEPSFKHEPDPTFVASAKASIKQSKAAESEDSADLHGKQE